MTMMFRLFGLFDFSLGLCKQKVMTYDVSDSLRFSPMTHSSLFALLHIPTLFMSCCGSARPISYVLTPHLSSHVPPGHLLMTRGASRSSIYISSLRESCHGFLHGFSISFRFSSIISMSCVMAPYFVWSGPTC